MQSSRNILVVITIFLAGCQSGVLSAATIKQTSKNPPAASQPEDDVQKLADLLESCDAHSPYRQYGDVKVNHDTVGVLLEVASHDLSAIQKAVKIFLSKSNGFSDPSGRYDLLRMLQGLIVNSPNSKVHICMSILVNRNGELRIEHEWPGGRTGFWVNPSFGKDIEVEVKKYGRRDLASFIAHHKKKQG